MRKVPSEPFIDIDSLLRPVYGHANRAPPTDTKIAGNRSGIFGALGEIRTHTVRVLNPFPLAFVDSSCVGCSTKQLVKALALLVS
jgi:hypothetical protein